MTDLDKLIEGALDWAANGVPVFPCAADKAPLTEHGHLDAVTDERKIRQLFEFFGDAAKFVGAVMGKESGLFAVDLDLYKDGVEAYAKGLREQGLLPPTRTHRTLRGGLHLLYRGDEQPNCKPHEGVEVKGDGGYIIVPPSPGYEVLEEGVKRAPDGLIAEFRAARRARAMASDDVLEANILQGTDFHESIVQLTARWSQRGLSMTQVQKKLVDTMMASVAASPHHPRHARWSSIMRDAGGELTRAVRSGHAKYNDKAASDALREQMAKAPIIGGSGDGAVPFFGAAQAPEPEVFNDDEWPFAGEGYFAHEQRDIYSASFTMYPIYAENETVVIFAEPKTGKTALAITTGLHVAAGYDLGPLKADGTGHVLYYGLEGKRAIELRIESWKRARSDAGEPVPDNIPFFAVEKSSNFLNEEVRKREANKIAAAARYSAKTGSKLKLIFIDTLTKAMSGGDQNSVEDTSALFDFVSLIRDLGVTATVVFVHHKSRTGNVRGSTNIEAEPDVLLDVSKEGSQVALRVARARSIEDGGVYNFKINGYNLGENAQGYAQSGIYVTALDFVPQDESEGLVAATEDNKKRALIVRLAVDGKTDVNQLVAVMFKEGMFPTYKRKPSASMPAIQKKLQELVPESGCVFGEHALRAEKKHQKVTHFVVSHLS